MESIKITGTGVSKGIGMGYAFLLKPVALAYTKESSKSADEEKARFQKALNQFISDTAALKDEVQKKAGAAEAEIMEGHINIASDPAIKGDVDKLLASEALSAEYACETVFENYAAMFESLGDELMSQRALDLRDIKQRIRQLLSGSGHDPMADMPPESILIAHDLTPSDTGKLDKGKVRGIVAETGGYTAHSAIMSRAMEIPAVLGVSDIMARVTDGTYMILDGESGRVLIAPDEAEMIKYKALYEEQRKAKEELLVYKDKKAVTADGYHAHIFANIGGPKDLEPVLANGGEGIGLFRTEFLFLDRADTPSEEEQFEAYKKVGEALEGKPVIIRTMDIGGDKEIPYLKMDKEENPFLGFRGIRMCLKERALFLTQLRAILRASVFGDLRIMLPMVAIPEEIRETRKLLKEAQRQLALEGRAFKENMEVGIMIETPAAAVCADLLAKECDFFSIGTNDLTQYTLAVDRGNKKVSYLYEAFNPGVLRLIRKVIKAGKEAGIMVGMCGEAAGDPLMIPFLLAAGLDEFSMTAVSIPGAKKQIIQLDKSVLEAKLEHLLSQATVDEVRAMLTEWARTSA